MSYSFFHVPNTKHTALLGWGTIGIFSVIVLLWFPLSPLRYGSENYLILFNKFLILAIWYTIAKIILFRWRYEQSNIAFFIRECSNRITILISTFVFLLPILHFGTMYMDLAAGLGLPLQDAWLAKIDQIIGFNWLAFLEFTNSSSLISTVLVQAYHSTVPQFMGLLLFLSLTKKCERLSEILALLAVTSLATAIIMLFVPAVGAYDYYLPARHLFDNFTQNAGMWHYDHLMALRSRQGMDFVITKSQGLVVFPSFHTVLAILTTYAVRDIRLLATPTAILNATVIVSTLPEGGHYLIDVLAGVVVAVGSILFVRRVGKDRIVTDQPQIVDAG